MSSRGRPKKVVENSTLPVVENSREAELLLQLDELKRKNEELENKNRESEINNTITDVFDTIRIPLDEYIKVISLCPMPLNLSTLGKGNGVSYRFERFGEVKRIIYSDLVKIIDAQRKFLEAGLFYIANSDVVRRHGLDEAYQKILTQEKIEKILSGKSQDAIELFKIANNDQKNVICNMMINKLQTGEELDLNLVGAITALSGVKILEKAEEAKQLFQVAAT